MSAHDAWAEAARLVHGALPGAVVEPLRDGEEELPGLVVVRQGSLRSFRLAHAGRLIPPGQGVEAAARWLAAIGVPATRRPGWPLLCAALAWFDVIGPPFYPRLTPPEEAREALRDEPPALEYGEDGVATLRLRAWRPGRSGGGYMPLEARTLTVRIQESGEITLLAA